jgi:hypothetical protein
MTRWFRVYDTLIDDPKVQRLPDGLFRAVINIWCLTSRAGGFLPPTGDIAFQLRISPDRVDKLIAELRRLDLVDEVDGRLCPHNWHGRQFASDRSNERVNKWREQRRNDASNGQRNVTSSHGVTPEETPPDSESDSESKISTSSPRTARGGEREKFGDFCRKYPDRDRPLNPDTTWQAWRQALREGADPDAIVACLERFAEAERRAGRVGTRYVPTAERFLREGRWKGYPAPAARPQGHQAPAEGQAAAPVDPRWAAVCHRLVGVLGADVVAAWFGKLKLVSIEGGVARLVAPTRFLRGYLETNYAPAMLAAFRAEDDAITRVEVLEPSQVAAAAPSAPATSEARKAEQEFAHSTLMTEGSRKVAVWLGTGELYPAMREINGWLALLGNDAVELVKLLAEAEGRKLAGKATIGWIAQRVAALKAPELRGLGVAVVRPPDEDAEPTAKRKRSGGRR